MSSNKTKLSASWQLNAALLSRPVDLTSLVSMSKTHPAKFAEDDVLKKLVDQLLNDKNLNKADKDTKLDVLNILANVANTYSYHNSSAGENGSPTKAPRPVETAPDGTGVVAASSINNNKHNAATNKIIHTTRSLVRNALAGISEWFDEYITEEYNASQLAGADDEEESEPELYKAMVLLLARCWDYSLKTEDVLELTQGNRRVALLIVIGLLEDGETYSTVLKQKQKPGVGLVGQWEHELVCHRYEKPLVLQICRLIRGFTHPTTYFANLEDGGSGGEIEVQSVERFADEMDSLLALTLTSGVIEKLSIALYDCLFNDELLYIDDEETNAGNPDAVAPESKVVESKTSSGAKGSGYGYGAGGGPRLLDESDHMAIICVHTYLQNLYFYATENNDEFRLHMLMDTLLIPRLILPYMDRCITHASILNKRANDYSSILGDEEADGAASDSKSGGVSAEDGIALMALHQPQLVKGLAASLRTLIIATFRAPPTQYVLNMLRRLNPTAHLVDKAALFLIHHDYIYSLVCCVNINMGVFDCISSANNGSSGSSEDGGGAQAQDPVIVANAYKLLKDLVALFNRMSQATQLKVIKRVQSSGALPISRDTPSYHMIISILYGGATSSQLDYIYKEIQRSMQRAGGATIGTAEDADAGAGGDGIGAEFMDGEGAGMDFGSTQSDYWNSRSEAKRAHNERMEAQRLALEAAGADGKGGKGAAAGADQKESKQSKETGKTGGGGLLGNLPSLSKGREQQENISIALSLQLPGESGADQQNKWNIPPSNRDGGDSKQTGPAAGAAGTEGLPKEFLCAINGHVMKEPMRVMKSGGSGLVFERATIQTWLKTRGAICPLTNTPLSLEDLQLDTELMNRIKRYKIEKVTAKKAPASVSSNKYSRPDDDDDDLYDF